MADDGRKVLVMLVHVLVMVVTMSVGGALDRCGSALVKPLQPSIDSFPCLCRKPQQVGFRHDASDRVL
jgi:hypothetical protein